MAGVRTFLPALVLAATTVMTGTVAWAQDASPAVDVLLSARSGRARARAADAIGRTRPMGGRQALEAALNDPDTHVRQSAADALAAYGDAAALPALMAHNGDHNRRVRDAVTRAVTDLRAHAPVAAATPPPGRIPFGASAPVGRPMVGAGVPAVGAGVPMAAGGGPVAGRVIPMEALVPPTVRTVEWRRVRYVVGVGSVVSQAREAGPYTHVIRTAIEQELGSHPGITTQTAGIPSDVSARMRSGAVRQFTVEGGVSVLRRVPMPAAAAVRAEVSLLLIAEPAHAIVGTIAGAATAQQPVLPGSLPAREENLTTHAIQAAVRSALANVDRSLASFHGH